jgi:hypothetical protein
VKHQGRPRGVEGSMKKEPKNKENHAQFIEKRQGKCANKQIPRK